MEELLKAAQAASQKLADLEMEYIDEEKRLGEQRSYVDNIKNGISQAVANARDESGTKPKFTNDLARKTEIEDRLAVHSVYRDAAAKLDDMTLAHQYNRVGIDQAHRNYQLAKLSYEVIAIGRRQ